MGAPVLIIDAEQAFADRLSDALRECGADPAVTPDGKAGLDLAQLDRPEAIVLCAELPRGMSGYSICAKIKKDPVLRAVPLILTSAEATLDTFESHKRLKTRAEEYLQKPFDPEALITVLTRYVTLGNGDPFRHEAYLPSEDDLAADPHRAGSAELRDEEDLIEDALRALDISQDPVLLEDLIDDDEDSMTAVGAMPQGGADSDEVEALRAKLEEELRLRRTAESERDGALLARRKAEAEVTAANTAASAALAAQRKAEAGASSSIPTLSSSIPSQGPSRDLLSLKKELNAKDHELLELRDRLHGKDKELLAQRDREMELEGRVVHVEEEGEANAAALSRDLEVERASGRSLAEALEAARVEGRAFAAEIEKARAEGRALGEAIARGRAENQALGRDLDKAKAEGRALGEEIEKAKAHAQGLAAEIERARAENQAVKDELASSEYEVDDLRKIVADSQRTIADLKRQVEGLNKGVAERDDAIAQASARIERDLEVESQTRKALELALGLLKEHEAGSREHEAADELRS